MLLPKTEAPAFVDERLLEALSHPTRAHALTVCTERPTSATQLGAELGENVTKVAYHLERLVELGCIEEVETKPRRGATEHFFRATIAHFFDQAAWEDVPAKDRLKITIGILREISGDLTKALLAGTVDDDDNHISRTVLTIDREGWGEVVATLGETLKKVEAIRVMSFERMAKTNEEPIRARVAILHFRSLSTAKGK